MGNVGYQMYHTNIIFTNTLQFMWRKGMHIENTIHHTLKPWYGFLFVEIVPH
jgi:hypothetical protein